MRRINYPTHRLGPADRAARDRKIVAMVALGYDRKLVCTRLCVSQYIVYAALKRHRDSLVKRGG